MFKLITFTFIPFIICDFSRNFLKQNFSINENDVVGTEIGVINGSIFRDKSVTFLPIMRALVDQYLYLESSTGKIKLKRTIDREIICPHSSNECVLQFKIKVLIKGNNESPKIIDVSIEIKDVNDNAPKFTDDEYRLKISESSKIGSRLFLPMAIDKDSESNGVSSYKIITDSSNKNIERDFQIINDRQTKILIPVLEQIRNIDRESIAKYKFTLKAEDVEGKFGETIINLSVDDANDNYPQWIGLPYKVNVRECDRLNQALFVLSASDNDQGSYGSVSYKISSLADPLVKTHFHLYGPKLFISTTLDYENIKHRKILIPVIAVDEGDLANTTNVEVNIEDCNDNSPIINVVFTKSPHSNTLFDTFNEKLSIDENNENEINIVHLEVTDGDSYENGRVTCKLENYQNYFRLDLLNDENEKSLLFQLIKNSGHSFDRETTSTIKLDINCMDNGQPQRSSRQSIVIVINDVNDNQPRLLSKLSFTIQENNDNGALICRLAAEDYDDNENKVVEFSMIFQSEEGIFHLTKDGNIYANKKLDREYKSKFVIGILLKDKGIPSLESSYNITIIVTDDNDGVPVYLGERIYNIFESYADTITQKVIANLNASDSDEGNNGSLEFILDLSKIVPYNVRSAYSLSKNGLLTVRGNLDREKAPIHQLLIIIQDKGLKPQSTTVQITIQLLDVNDNKPVFTFPNEKETNLNLTLDLAPETIITVLKAEDKDLGENGTVNFDARPKSIYFEVDKSGNVILKKSLGQSGQYFISKYTINVCAFDLGSKSLQQYASLSIYVTDSSPEINKKKYDNGRENYKKDDKSEEIDSMGLDSNKKRKQMNVLILMVMAVLVMIVFFAVVAVLSFMYLKKERFTFFGRNGSTRNTDKAGTNYNQKMNQQSHISRMSSYPNLTGNPMHRYNSKESMNQGQYNIESNMPNNSNMYNTLIIPQTNQFDKRVVSTDNIDLHQKMALLNYSNLFESEQISEIDREGYFSLHHNNQPSNVEMNYRLQWSQVPQPQYESKTIDSIAEFHTPKQQKRSMKMDSSFV